MAEAVTAPSFSAKVVPSTTTTIKAPSTTTMFSKNTHNKSSLNIMLLPYHRPSHHHHRIKCLSRINLNMSSPAADNDSPSIIDDASFSSEQRKKLFETSSRGKLKSYCIVPPAATNTSTTTTSNGLVKKPCSVSIVNLERYFDRMGVRHQPKPDLDNHQTSQRLHVFKSSNLNLLNKSSTSLNALVDLDSQQQQQLDSISVCSDFDRYSFYSNGGANSECGDFVYNSRFCVFNNNNNNSSVADDDFTSKKKQQQQHKLSFSSSSKVTEWLQSIRRRKSGDDDDDDDDDQNT